MKRPNNSNLIEENEQHKQKAQFLTLHKNYKEVIECYKKIAKNFKIEEKTEKNVSAKNNLKCNLKYIKKLIKDLRTVSNSFNEILLKDKDFLFKDLQDSYYFFEDLDIKDDDFLEQDDIFEGFDINVDVSFEQDDKFGIPKKNCYSCKRVITLNDIKIANLSIAEEHLRRLFESPYVEFYCCDCFEMKSPFWIVGDLISFLSLLEKNIKYQIERIWNSNIWTSNCKIDELKSYLKEVIKIKNNEHSDLSQDNNLISLIKRYVPDFTFEDSTIIVKETVLYHKFEDYEKAIILLGLTSPIYGDLVMGDGSIVIPKRFQTSNFSKAVGILYKRARRSNKFHLTEFGDRKISQIISQIEKKINAFVKLSHTFKAVFNL